MNISIRFRSLKEKEYINLVSTSGYRSEDGYKRFSQSNGCVTPRIRCNNSDSNQYFSFLKVCNKFYIVSEKFRNNDLLK